MYDTCIWSLLSAPGDKRLQVQVRLQKGLKCCRAFYFNPFRFQSCSSDCNVRKGSRQMVHLQDQTD